MRVQALPSLCRYEAVPFSLVLVQIVKHRLLVFHNCRVCTAKLYTFLFFIIFLFSFECLSNKFLSSLIYRPPFYFSLSFHYFRCLFVIICLCFIFGYSSATFLSYPPPIPDGLDYSCFDRHLIKNMFTYFYCLSCNIGIA